MKSNAVFPLEAAGWPALLVDGASSICRASPSAVKLFGAALESTSPSLSAIWSPENNLSPDQFLAQWERSPAPTVLLKLRARGGGTISSLTSVCSFQKDGQKFFVLQILPEGGPPTAAPADLAVENGLAQQQKLDCALQMARSVALDFNNALTGILGHTSLVLSHLDPSHPSRASLLEVEKSAARAAEIANDLGMFSRQEKEPRGQAEGNANLLVQRTVEFFQAESAPSAPVEWQLLFEKKLFTTRFDEAKMQQAFIKILENSLQAFHGGGRITVQTRNVELAEPAQDRNAHLTVGAYVLVEFSDNGCGIEPEILPRIFEPFFTTKGAPHRGLGLAWVYGIVTNHGGGVAVSSQPGAGTSVRVYLPAEKRILRENGVPSDDLRGTQSVLMVDDEDLLLTMGRAVLSAYGYHVTTANTGQKALDVLAAQDHVELVITDLVMPTMSGRELVEHIHRRSPDTRILYTSGYVWPAGHPQESNYLQKPFTSRDLLLKVRQVLAG